MLDVKDRREFRTQTMISSYAAWQYCIETSRCDLLECPSNDWKLCFPSNLTACLEWDGCLCLSLTVNTLNNCGHIEFVENRARVCLFVCLFTGVKTNFFYHRVVSNGTEKSSHITIDVGLGHMWNAFVLNSIWTSVLQSRRWINCAYPFCICLHSSWSRNFIIVFVSI